MKKLFLIALSLMLTLSVVAQETDLEEMKEELSKKNTDTTNIRFKRKTVKIVEDNGETQIFVKKHNNDRDWEWFWDDNDRFKGSWSGFSFGLSNLVDKDFSVSRSGDDQFMDLNTGKSWNMNFNFAQYSFKIAGDKLGLVTGLGLEWNYYRFDNDVTIQKDDEGIISPVDLSITEPDWSIEKSKLSTTYATLPLLLEFHSSSHQNRGIVISVGAIGGLKLGSNTKIVYKENGDKNKDKTKDDYSLSPFRYGFHARLGVGDWLIYGTYYVTPLFEKDKLSTGTDLYPISIGIALSFD